MESSFHDLVNRAEAGDPSAQEEIFEAYSRRLASLARSRLQGPLKRKVDADDILQSVFRSFFSRQQSGRLEVTGRGSLWNLLAKITLRKCGRQLEYFRAACRDVNLEQPSSNPSDTSFQAASLTADSEPTPIESAMLIETLEKLSNELSDRDRKILECSLQGMDIQEISSYVECSERTVERIRARIREILESWSQS